MTKNKKNKEVNPQTKNVQEEDINQVLKEADRALLITTKQGNISIRALKNVNFSYEAKGILQAALDNYLILPINSTLRNLSDVYTNSYNQLLFNIRETLAPKKVVTHDTDTPVEDAVVEEVGEVRENIEEVKANDNKEQ